MRQTQQRVDMFEPAIYRIRISGMLTESWSEYFGVQSISVEKDEAGRRTTTLISEPVDQAALVGMINHLNGLGLAMVSVECVQAPVKDEPEGKGDA